MVETLRFGELTVSATLIATVGPPPDGLSDIWPLGLLPGVNVEQLAPMDRLTGVVKLPDGLTCSHGLLEPIDSLKETAVPPLLTETV